MKCPACGADILSTDRFCTSCRRPIDLFIKKGIDVSAKEISKMESERRVQTGKLVRLIRDSYSQIPQNEDERVMENLEKIVSKSLEPNRSIDQFLKDVSELIHRSFGFIEIAIGLKDKKDGRYKYKNFYGLRKNSEKAYQKISYSYEDMIDAVKFERIKLSNYCDFFPGEYSSYLNGEEDTFSRPSLLGQRRINPDDLIEGDYFCFYMYGKKNELIGWFELSRNKNNKFPQRNTIKWLELISAICGKCLSEK